MRRGILPALVVFANIEAAQFVVQDSGVTRGAAPFAHPVLRVPTPLGWLRKACASQDVLLIDHANCEKKAASTALALMFAYAEDLDLTGKMSRLAREELRHYEQVVKLIRRLGVVPLRLAPGRYAERLRRQVAKSDEYNASRRSSAPTPPLPLARSACVRMRCL